jgi:acetyltransferase-like isoleucine patch superfamily enzyme
MGAKIIQGISIGPWTVVGAGAAVVRDLPANVTAVGVPARVIKTKEEFWFEK